MQKISLLAVIVSLLSCKNVIESNSNPQLERDLCESLYMNKPTKNDEYVIHTNIDSVFQKTSKKALEKSLKEYDADNGFVVVMEANTGKIKALVGLEKDGDLNYNLSKNIAINSLIEPGSLIKPFNIMCLLEDKKVDTSTVYDSYGGKFTLYGKNINDSHLGLQKLSIKEAFLNSSNTIFAQAIDNAYRNTPNLFVENFNKFGLGLQYSQLGCNPSVPSPNSNSWAKITLPWMAIGYGLEVTPIQLLTFYNSIANNGAMVEPLLISKIQTNETNLKEYSTTILKKSICSEETILVLNDLLREAVAKGSCQIVSSKKVVISGYSSTTLIDYSRENSRKKFLSSFIGYFKSSNEKYTVLVCVRNPNTDKAYHGSIVAGKVVKTIAEELN